MLQLDSAPKIARMRWRLMLADYSGSGVFIGKGSRLLARTEIGDGTRINGRCVVKGSGKLTIGRYCAIGDGVRFLTSNHSTKSVANQYAIQREIGLAPAVAKKKDVTVGHDVWIGDGAILLPGLTVGSGAVVGAGAVVSRDVDPYTVVAGNPARVIRKRVPDEIAAYLLKLAWWEWPKEKMLAARAFFAADLEASTVDDLRQLLG